MTSMMKIFHIITALLLVVGGSVHAAQTANRRALDSLTNLIERLDGEARREGTSDSLLFERAQAWRNYAYTAQRLGMTEDGQLYAQRAYEAFVSVEEYGWASLCLYERCIAYNSIGDTTHVSELLGELSALARRDTSALTQYNYYAILFAYLMLDAPEASAQDEDDARRNAIEQASMQTIRALERIADYRRYHIMPVWTYYNHALIYDMLYAPPQTDSIARYLALAEASAAEEPELIDRQEAAISIGDERAWLYYYKSDYARAEQQMKQVLALLDSVQTDSPASIITERGEAYAFMVELYEAQSRHAEALAYQQLLTDNNTARYSIERQRVLDEVQTKYEVEKQQLTIRHQKEVIRYLIMVSVLALLFIASALVAVWYRKCETEEELYTQALEAESIYNELETLRQSKSIEPLQVLRDGLIAQIKDNDVKQKIANVNLDVVRDIVADAHGLSMMDKRYLLCFHAGLSAEQIAGLFNISPASVYTVRYRIGKKNAHLKGIF